MLIEKPSSYVKAGQNIHHGDKVKLLDEGKWEEMKSPDGKTKKVLQFQMALPSGEIKTYTMNNSTMDNLTSAYGQDSINWMKKDLKVWINKEKRFGKVMNVLYLTSPDWNEPFISELEAEQNENEENIPVLEDEN